jgi:hypothetical protein
MRLLIVQFSAGSYSCVHFSGLLDVQVTLSADMVTSRQNKGHSFGDHLISESVSVTPSSVIEASIVLCSVSLWLVWVNIQSACALNIRYLSWVQIFSPAPCSRTSEDVWMGGYGLVSSSSGWDPVAGSCKHSTEPSTSIKGGEFLECLLMVDAAPWSFVDRCLLHNITWTERWHVNIAGIVCRRNALRLLGASDMKAAFNTYIFFVSFKRGLMVVLVSTHSWRLGFCNCWRWQILSSSLMIG